MNNIIVLQSGFVTNSDKNLSQPPVESRDEKIRAALAHTVQIGIENPFHFSQEVTNLMKEIRATPSLMAEFDFREKILLTAKACFADISINDWVRLQKQGKYYSMSHKKFIEDTKKFLDEGVRTTTIGIWATMLSPRIITDSDRRYPEVEYGITSATPKNVLEARNFPFVVWCQQENGFSDLLYFLNTVFGEYKNRIKI